MINKRGIILKMTLILFVMFILAISSFYIINAKPSKEKKIEDIVISKAEKDGKVRVIVEFKEKDSKKKNKLINEVGKEKIRHDFSKENKISLTLSEEEIKNLENDDSVKRVYYDNPVHAFLQDSVPLIGADKAWELDQYGNKCIESNNECLTGKNIKIIYI